MIDLKKTKVWACVMTVDSGSAANPMHVVCTLPEQIAIAAVLTDMDAELAQLKQCQAKNRAWKQGMGREMIIGTVRLI